MEDKSTTSNVLPTIPTTTATDAAKNRQNGSEKNKKKKRALNIFKAAMLLLRIRPTEKKSKKSLQIEVTKNENWKKIVGSMRPLHLQEQPSLSPPPAAATLPSVRSFDNFEDVYPSPGRSTASGSTSQYGSANNLQEIDKSEDDDDDKAGDAMIDAKAEEFIAHFYERMRLQNTRRMRRA